MRFNFFLCCGCNLCETAVDCKTKEKLASWLHGQASKSLNFISSVGGEFQVLVAQISKFKEGGGLGISLEGTVEKIDGAEQNPHHYIRYLLILTKSSHLFTLFFSVLIIITFLF